METKKLLEELTTGYAPSGREYFMYPTIKNIFQKFGEVTIDDMNNIIIHKKGNNKGKIMIMAHLDEIFMLVTEVCQGGFIKFKSVGIDNKAIVSNEVVIHGKQKISGVIGINYFDEESKEGKFDANSLVIDTGLRKEQLEKVVKIGDFITLKGDFVELFNNNVASKSIDDRAGIVTMYKCAEQLQQKEIDMDIYYVCSCQEEVGHRGAKMASYNINPDIGIAIDTTFDNGLLGDKERENKIGNGPAICIGPNIHPKLSETIIQIANNNNILYQVEIEPGNTGTDAWDIQITKEGIPTLLISLPIKHMHTSVELINVDDIENTGLLISKLIEYLNSKNLEEILCF